MATRKRERLATVNIPFEKLVDMLGDALGDAPAIVELRYRVSQLEEDIVPPEVPERSMAEQLVKMDGPEKSTFDTADVWKHRSAGMRCSSCMYYVPKGFGTNPAAPDGDRIELGRCRRHAPALGGWPVVTPRDWCGDHKLA